MLLDLIKLSLWGEGNAIADQNTYEEMRQQTIATLPAPYLSTIFISPELKEEWGKYILSQVSKNIKINYEQSNLPLTVQYAILKGTSAAQYYPYPQYRAMGDIDVITRREDFDVAVQQLTDAGYQKKRELNKETIFVKNGVVVELHKRFASLNNADQAKYLDDLVFSNINSSHILPEQINGLTLLAHINQHLELGLGLRQIIDWMMFIDKCLPDERWPEFKALVDNIGLTNLAVTVTRMCEMYLGLPNRGWCSCADESLCKQLMEYILSSGNFGKKRISETDISENVLAYASTPKTAFQLLQKQGLINWKAAHKYKILRPVAWIYQLNRYVFRGLRRDQAAKKLKTEIKAARKRIEMFDALGVRTTAKGNIIFKNGQYVKE